MSFSRLSMASAATIAALSVFIFAGRGLVFAAQAPPTQPHEEHHHPAPTNLKVLPRNLTGEQVHEIMEKWEGELGTGCKTCHAVDKNAPPGPNGRQPLNFADDSKEEKRTAREMFKMVETINVNYISKIDSSGDPVTCGTCHRGHLGPQAFVPPPENDHPGPPPPGAKPPAGR